MLSNWIFDELPDDLFDHIGSFCQPRVMGFIEKSKNDFPRKQTYLMRKLAGLCKSLHAKYRIFDLHDYRATDEGIARLWRYDGFMDEELPVNRIHFDEVPKIPRNPEFHTGIRNGADYIFVWDPSAQAYADMHITHTHPQEPRDVPGTIRTNIRNTENEIVANQPISLIGLELNRSRCRGLRIMLRKSFWNISKDIRYENNGHMGTSYYANEFVRHIHNEDYVELALNALFQRLIQINDAASFVPAGMHEDGSRSLVIIAADGFWEHDGFTTQLRPIKIYAFPPGPIRNFFVSGINLEFCAATTEPTEQKIFLRNGARITYNARNERHGARVKHLSIHCPIRQSHEMQTMDLGQAANSIVIVNPGNLEIRGRNTHLQTRTIFINETTRTNWIRNDGGTIWHRRQAALGGTAANRIPYHYRPINIGHDPVPSAYYSSEDNIVVVFSGGKNTIMKIASLLQLPPPHFQQTRVLGKRRRKRDNDDAEEDRGVERNDVISIQSD